MDSVIINLFLFHNQECIRIILISIPVQNGPIS